MRAWLLVARCKLIYFFGQNIAWSFALLLPVCLMYIYTHFCEMCECVMQGVIRDSPCMLTQQVKSERVSRGSREYALISRAFCALVTPHGALRLHVATATLYNAHGDMEIYNIMLLYLRHSLVRKKEALELNIRFCSFAWNTTFA